jgi:hypothetical protein
MLLFALCALSLGDNTLQQIDVTVSSTVPTDTCLAGGASLSFTTTVTNNNVANPGKDNMTDAFAHYIWITDPVASRTGAQCPTAATVVGAQTSAVCLCFRMVEAHMFPVHRYNDNTCGVLIISRYGWSCDYRFAESGHQHDLQRLLLLSAPVDLHLKFASEVLERRRWLY